MADTPRLQQATSEQLIEAQESGTIIIDIRREDEWASTGIIAGAKTITAFTETGQLHADFHTHFANIVPSESAKIMLYCRSGQRTKALGNALITQLGYTQVSHLSKGIMGWMGNGFDTTPYQP